MNGKVRVFVAEEEPQFREAYKSMLASEPDIEVVGLSDTLVPADLGDVMSRSIPDVLLYGVKTLVVDVVYAFRSIREQYPKVGFILLSGSYDVKDIKLLRLVAAKGQSGCACLFKYSSEGTKDLSKVIRSVAEGRVILDPEMMGNGDPPGGQSDQAPGLPGGQPPEESGFDVSRRLCDALAANLDRILEAWVADLRRRPRTDAHWRFGTRRLTTGIKDLLGALVPVLTSPDSRVQRDFLREARHLGELRQAQGFKIGNVVDEYAALRRLIWPLLNEGLVEDMAEVFDFAQRLDLALDSAIETSVEVFHEIEREELLEHSSVDTLTGLRNRAHFWDRLGEELARARRYGQPIAVLMMDIDDFKEYNDRHGHLLGDTALTQVAGILQGESRASDCVARYGGEEFAIIMPQTGATGAIAASERIRNVIAAHDFSAGATSRHLLTVSIGCAICEGDCVPRKDLADTADKALYEAKNEGKNRACAYVFRAGKWVSLS